MERASNETRFAERKVGGLPGNDVVEETDLEQVGTVAHAASDAPVGLAWRWVTRRVIVHQNDAVGARHNRRPEDFAGVGNCFVQASNRNNVVTSWTQFRIQQDRDKVLLVGFKSGFGRNYRLPEFKGFSRFIKRSPAGSVVGKQRLAHPSKNDTKGSLRLGRIVSHNNFFQERTPQV